MTGFVHPLGSLGNCYILLEVYSCYLWKGWSGRSLVSHIICANSFVIHKHQKFFNVHMKSDIVIPNNHPLIWLFHVSLHLSCDSVLLWSSKWRKSMEHHTEEPSTFRLGSSTHHFHSYSISIEEKSITWPCIILMEPEECSIALSTEEEEISFLINWQPLTIGFYSWIFLSRLLQIAFSEENSICSQYLPSISINSSLNWKKYLLIIFISWHYLKYTSAEILFMLRYDCHIYLWLH